MKSDSLHLATKRPNCKSKTSKNKTRSNFYKRIYANDIFYRDLVDEQQGRFKES